MVVVGSKAQVKNGSADKTAERGVDKKGLKKNSRGEIVYKEASKAAKKAGLWAKAVKKAYKKLGLEGFHPITKGGKLYDLTKAEFEKMKKCDCN